MKVLAIGDPHGGVAKLRRISAKVKEDADVILLTGDLGKVNLGRKLAFEDIRREREGLPKLEQTKKQRRDVHREVHTSTMDVLKYLSQYAPVYTIEGNVGLSSPAEVAKLEQKYGVRLPSTRAKIDELDGACLVKNRLRVFEGLRVGFLEYFTDVSWVREFRPKNYRERMQKVRKETEKAKRVLKRFGKVVDILVCHQPPFGVLDKVGKPAPVFWRGKRAGSQAVLDYIKKYQPRYVFCGHIHEGEGMKKVGKTEVHNLGVCGWKLVEL